MISLTKGLYWEQSEVGKGGPTSFCQSSPPHSRSSSEERCSKFIKAWFSLTLNNATSQSFMKHSSSSQNSEDGLKNVWDFYYIRKIMQVRIPQLNCRVFKSAFLLVFFFSLWFGFSVWICLSRLSTATEWVKKLLFLRVGWYSSKKKEKKKEKILGNSWIWKLEPEKSHQVVWDDW